MSQVHPTAIVASRAELGRDVVIGPYSIVEDDVVLGDGSQIDAHVVIASGTRIGARARIYPFVALGGAPQDKRYAGEPTHLEIGSDTTFREHATAHRGTAHGASVTRVGNGCLIMASAHVAHDCVIGDGVVLANATLLGGHAEIGDHVVTGGHVAVAPFVRVGARAFLAGNAMVEHDVPPFVIAAGDRARVRALNRVGLERAGISEESKTALERAFRAIFRGTATRAEAAGQLVDDPDPFVRELARFVMREPARRSPR